MDSTKKYNSIDEYIESQEIKTHDKLRELREIIKKTAPNTLEVISYGMPAFRQHGVLVYFAANKNHIGLYPTASPVIVFAEELSDYKTSKGAIQFPLNKEIPAELVQKIVTFRINEDEMSFSLKKKKK